MTLVKSDLCYANRELKLSSIFFLEFSKSKVQLSVRTECIIRILYSRENEIGGKKSIRKAIRK